MSLKAAIINGTATNPDLSKSTKGQLNDWYPIVSFHFEDPGSIGLVNIKHLLTGPIKSYQTPADILQEVNYFENIPLNEQISLEMNQPGLNYLVLAVQFADGASSIYSGVMDVDAFGSKSDGENYLEFQLNEGATFRVMDTSSVGNIQSDTPFLNITSNIICSELSNNGFQVCQQGGALVPSNGVERPFTPSTNLFSDSEDEDEDEDEDDDDNDDNNDGDGGNGRSIDLRSLFD
jgi:hypothetical protein